jgi:hypothetical protein
MDSGDAERMEGNADSRDVSGIGWGGVDLIWSTSEELSDESTRGLASCSRPNESSELAIAGRDTPWVVSAI